MSTWDPIEAGVLTLPSGRRIRGRSLRKPINDGAADFSVVLLGRQPQLNASERWIQWPDFWLPTDTVAARSILEEAWRRSAEERVEIMCGGGIGRTGTALACIAVIDGVPPAESVAFVRANYHPSAIETPWQKRFVKKFR